MDNLSTKSIYWPKYMNFSYKLLIFTTIFIDRLPSSKMLCNYFNQPVINSHWHAKQIVAMLTLRLVLPNMQIMFLFSLINIKLNHFIGILKSFKITFMLEFNFSFHIFLVILFFCIQYHQIESLMHYVIYQLLMWFLSHLYIKT